MALKDDMPMTAAWIAELRRVFGDTPHRLAAFNAQLRAGMDGQPTFYAAENGRTVGTPDLRTYVRITPPLETAQEASAAAARPITRYKDTRS